jgi:hypothetical protein
MTTENNTLPFVAFFTNDVSALMNSDLEQAIDELIKQKIVSGELDMSTPIAITVKDDRSFILENKVLEEPVDLKVEPGLISLPANYTDTTRESLASDPIYQKHMEDVWGF